MKYTVYQENPKVKTCSKMMWVISTYLSCTCISLYRLILIDYIIYIVLRVGPLKNKMTLELKFGWLRLVYPCDQHESKSSNNIPAMMIAPEFPEKENLITVFP